MKSRKYEVQFRVNNDRYGFDAIEIVEAEGIINAYDKIKEKYGVESIEIDEVYSK